MSPIPVAGESIHLQGSVLLNATTDGHQVVDVKLKSGHPYLAPDAVKSVRTWKFADQAPTTFTVTYLYVNQGRFKRDKSHQVCSQDGAWSGNGQHNFSLLGLV